MKIAKGTLLNVVHRRKGKFIGIAERDFDITQEEFYPIALAQEAPVKGFSGRPKWFPGDSISCRNSLCFIEPI